MNVIPQIQCAKYFILNGLLFHIGLTLLTLSLYLYFTDQIIYSFSLGGFNIPPLSALFGLGLSLTILVLMSSLNNALRCSDSPLSTPALKTHAYRNTIQGMYLGWAGTNTAALVLSQTESAVFSDLLMQPAYLSSTVAQLSIYILVSVLFTHLSTPMLNQ